MATATCNGTVIAESDATVIVEGNHYFPIESVRGGLLQPSDATSVCPWKGTAADFDVVIGDDVLPAAFHYPEPKPAAAQITGRVACWGDVEVS